MPVNTAKKTIKKTADATCRAIRTHWSPDEARHRRQLADAMQARLVESLGLRSMSPR